MKQHDGVFATGRPLLVPRARADPLPQASSASRQDLDTETVLTLLEEDQLVSAKREPLGRGRYGRGVTVILWLMRLYVIGMFVVVALQVAQALR